MSRRLTVPLVVAAALAVGTARAEWVAARGERLFGPEMSESEACQMAERTAKEQALQRIAGEHLSSEDLMVCSEAGSEASCDLNQFTWTVIDGAIAGVREKTVRTLDAAPGYRTCLVELEADVRRPPGEPDPGFDMTVRLNASVFRDGDPLRLAIEPSQSMYVHVFQWLPYMSTGEQVMRVFPNPLDPDNRFAGPSTVPTEAGSERYDLVVGFPQDLPPGKRLADEYLMIVATREPVRFRESYTLEEFNARLLELPRADTRRVKRAYAVVRR